jgi:hypothetical protein
MVMALDTPDVPAKGWLVIHYYGFQQITEQKVVDTRYEDGCIKYIHTGKMADSRILSVELWDMTKKNLIKTLKPDDIEEIYPTSLVEKSEGRRFLARPEMSE